MKRMSIRYSEAVLEGEIPAGSYLKKCCQRFLHDLAREDLKFDEVAADNVRKFIELVPHTEGIDGQVKLAAWQHFLIDNIYGFFYRDSLGEWRRRFTTAYVFVPRKNGKSLLAACIALYHLLGDGEKGAKIICAATRREQANLVFDTAKNMVRRTPPLAAFLKTLAYEIRAPDTQSVMRAISAEADKAHGFNPSCVIADECHQWLEKPGRTNMWSVLKNGQISRRNPLIFAITTAGNNKESKGYELYQHATRVLIDPTKKVDDRFFCFLSHADVKDAWDDIRSTIKANPLMQTQLGQKPFLSEAKMQDEIQTAKGIISDQTEYKRYHLNIWDFAGDQKWLDSNQWDALKFENADLAGRPCFVGVDLSAVRDLTAITFLFPNYPKLGQVFLLPYFFLPSSTIDERKDKINYHKYIEHDNLKVIVGDTIDYDELFSIFQALAKRFKIKKIATDPHMATHFTKKLVDAHYPVEEITATLNNLSEPRKEMEKMIYDKRIYHDGSMMMSWCISNVCLEITHDGKYKLHKPSASQKIDGVDAAVNAICLWHAEELNRKQMAKFCPHPLLSPKRMEWVREHDPESMVR